MNIEEIAREKNIVPYIISPRNDEYLGRLQAFAAAVIKAHEAKLIAGVGEPVYGSDTIQLYTGTQVAAAVAKAKQERIAELESTLKWLDRWMGHKPLAECAKKIKEVLHD